MRRQPAILLAIALILLLGAPYLVADEDGMDYDNMTAIGPDAKEKMLELVRLYQAAMKNDLQDLVVRVKDDSDPTWWSEALRDISDKRFAWRGTALDLYRGWAKARGADSANIEDFPSDWVSAEGAYAVFFEVAADQGLKAFTELVGLVKDASYMNGYVWTDGLRIDDAIVIATEADHDLKVSRDLLAELASGRGNTSAIQKELERLRENLRWHTNAWQNRLSMLNDMMNRVKGMTTGDMEASKRTEKVDGLFGAFTKAVEDNEWAGARSEAEAASYHLLIKPHLKFFEKMQEDWLERVAPVTENTIFNKLPRFKGRSYDQFSVPLSKRIVEINEALK